MLDKKYLIGYTALLSYCLITALSALSIHHVTQRADPSLTALYTFIICAAFFNIVNYKNFFATYRLAIQNKKVIFLLNVTTTITWLTTFWGLKFLGPTLFVTIYMGVIPLYAYVMSLLKTKKIYWDEFIATLGIALLIVAIVIVHQFFLHDTKFYSKGIILALLSGYSASLFMIYSAKVHQKLNFTPIQILAVRFYLLIFSVITIFFAHYKLQEMFIDASIFHILFIALVSSIFPLFLLQTGIHRLGSVKSSYMVPSTLVFAYLFELIYGTAFNLPLGLLVILLSIILSITVIIQQRKRK